MFFTYGAMYLISVSNQPPETVATNMVNANKSFFYHSFFNALSSDRQTRERDAIVKQLFEKLWTEVVKAPSHFPPGYTIAKLVIEKTV
jgi:hypothetical protein